MDSSRLAPRNRSATLGSSDAVSRVSLGLEPAEEPDLLTPTLDGADDQEILSMGRSEKWMLHDVIRSWDGVGWC